MLPLKVANRSPFRAGGGALAPPRVGASPRSVPQLMHSGAADACIQRKSSMDTGLQRQFSLNGSGVNHTITRARSTACNGLGSISEASVAGSSMLELLTDPTAASASFDEMCEVLGDVAKLDMLSSTVGSSLLQQQGLAAASALKALITNNAALSWIAEKAAANLHQFTLLEGLVDKTLLDLFQQLYGVLDLDGTVFDSAPVRLAVAAGIALLVRHLIVQHKAAHPSAADGPAGLARQLSPAASLSDVLADSAAAAIIAQAVRGPTKAAATEQHQPALAPAFATGTAGSISNGLDVTASAASSPFAAAVTGQATTDQQSRSAFTAVSSSLLSEQQLAPADKARVAAHSLLACMLLGQFKRFNKLKRKVLRAGADLSQGSLSPTALLACIEGAVLLHNYSELANGVSTLLHIGA